MERRNGKEKAVLEERIKQADALVKQLRQENQRLGMHTLTRPGCIPQADYFIEAELRAFRGEL